MTRFVALIALCLVGAAAPAFADCGSADGPMTASDGFGVASCREYAPRYDSRVFEIASDKVASAEDPMVWSDDQWRSSLLNYNQTSNGGYDRRARALPQNIEVQVERRDAVEQKAEPTAHTKASGPKHIDVDSRREIGARPGVLAFEGHKCRGALILTWSEGRSTARCNAGRRFQMLRGG